jgi:hypothetical protein
MSFATLQTSRQLTAPGYFDFSGSQSVYTGKVFAWIDSAMQVWINQLNLMDSFFRLWLSYDYSVTTVSRTPYVQKKLNDYGIGWFRGSDTQGAALVGLVSRGYSNTASENFQFLFSKLSSTPFLWCDPVVQLIYGTQYPALYAETLLIYSNSVGLPATPSPQTYIERAWAAPVGWTQAASESTYFSRGYLSGSDIVWMAPQSTSTVYPYYNVAEIADLPVAPDTGSLAGVQDDGTGDEGAIYYYDGAVWRKTTTPNVNQGTVASGSVPTPSPRAVAAPNPDSLAEPLTSLLQPPVSGPSQGYGMYGGYAQILLSARNIALVIKLTAAGVQNLGIIINLLRRIKPTLNALTLYYTTELDNTPVQIEILDARALA